MAKTSKLEPYIDSKKNKMVVGDLLIPPTNTLTALLYGVFTSGCVWLIHTIQEYFERSNPSPQ